MSDIYKISVEKVLPLAEGEKYEKTETVYEQRVESPIFSVAELVIFINEKERKDGN